MNIKISQPRPETEKYLRKNLLLPSNMDRNPATLGRVIYLLAIASSKTPMRNAQDERIPSNKETPETFTVTSAPTVSKLTARSVWSAKLANFNWSSCKGLKSLSLPGSARRFSAQTVLTRTGLVFSTPVIPPSFLSSVAKVSSVSQLLMEFDKLTSSCDDRNCLKIVQEPRRDD